ncbi:putative ABC transport system permease protein [Rathayibacter sp. PhB127]|uniref:ABC transporter permease n=1 Tax=Rathayibacter sp. PhB127 TaxID=2485176 RepID=UPI000FA566A5|nr:ABC transporter permease [Rathayibacter sp. PhB127]ROS30099.1 putative ABC transport system permease protein [Rathayibacter sp. PhB127]
MIAAVAICAAVSTVALLVFGVASFARPSLAILRGAAQLAVLAVILSGVIADVRWVLLFLALMFGAAVLTASGRLGRTRRTVLAVTAAMAAGVAVSAGIVFGLGAVPFTGRYVLAVGGILLGGAMTVATVTGRALAATLADRWDQVEGWLALGARPRQATIGLAREAAWTGLVPLTDQTRTTGLVVLPGAFIGAVFGGLSPVAAGVFQIVVLAGLIASGSIVAVVLLTILRGDVVRPRP